MRRIDVGLETGRTLGACLFVVASGLACSGSALPPEASLARDVPGTVILLARTQEPSAYMDALLIGRLALDSQGCLRAGDEQHTLIWPTGYSAQSRAEGTRIVDHSGRIVATVGEALRVGGGELSSLEQVPLAPADAQRATSDCPGRYWIVAGP